MSPEAKIWIGGGVGAAFLVWLLGRQSSGGSAVLPEGGDDLSAVTQMLLTETSFALGQEEMAQIVWVAVNRSKNWGVSLADVVRPYPPGTRRAWNTGPVYARLFAAAPRSSRWTQALAFVQDVIAGRVAPNLGYTVFVHPQNMAVPPCVSTPTTPRIEMSTVYGARCLPPWIDQGVQVGRGLFA